MKFYNIQNIDAFFKVVETCEGKIELVTSDGDRLNLKSRLCQYISFVNLINNAEIKEMEIVAYNPEDTMKLLQFMIEDGGHEIKPEKYVLHL